MTRKIELSMCIAEYIKPGMALGKLVEKQTRKNTMHALIEFLKEGKK